MATSLYLQVTTCEKKNGLLLIETYSNLFNTNENGQCHLCWQQIEMSGSVTNELSALSTPVVGNVGRLFYWFRTFF
jgi:hypothetical protein